MKLNCASLEDWYPGQPATILRRVEVIELRTFDGAPRVDVRILEGPEAGRIVTNLSPGNLEPTEEMRLDASAAEIVKFLRQINYAISFPLDITLHDYHARVAVYGGRYVIVARNTANRFIATLEPTKGKL